MSETNIVATLIAILTALPPTLMAYASLRQGKRNEVVAGKIVAKTDEIHILTNSNLTKVKLELELAKEEIKDLQCILLEHMQSKKGSI
jgi:hypothetical protein